MDLKQINERIAQIRLNIYDVCVSQDEWKELKELTKRKKELEKK